MKQNLFILTNCRGISINPIFVRLISTVLGWLVFVTPVFGPSSPALHAAVGDNHYLYPYTGSEPDTLLLFHFDEPDELSDSGPSGLDLSGFYGSTYVSPGRFGDAYTNPDSGGYTICNNGSVVFGPEGHTDGRDTRVIEFWLKLFAEQFDVNGNFRLYGGQTSIYVNLVRGQGGIGMKLNVGANTAQLFDSWCYPPSAMSPALTWAPNVWYHLAFEHIDSVGTNLYRDGVCVANTSLYHNARFSNPNGSLVLGDYLGYQRDGLVGQMDEFRISDTPFNPVSDDPNGPAVVIIESDNETIVTEGGTTDSYQVVLQTRPTAQVVITATPNDNQIDIGENAGVARILTFATSAWDIPQTVTVTAVNDDVYEGGIYAPAHITTITHTAVSGDNDYHEIGISSVDVRVIDNDETCGDWGYNYADLNQDCYVNLVDFAKFAAQWLKSLEP